MRMQRSGAVFLFIAGLASQASAQTMAAQSATHPVGPPFTIGKSTTAISGPRRADGTIDYIAALNDRYRQGVTPQNNGFVLWLQVTGTEDVLAPKAIPEYLRLSGAQPIPAGATVWERHETYMQKLKGPDAVDAAYEELHLCMHTPWSAKEHPDLAAFLKAREGLLTLAAQAADRPKWWRPAVALDGKTVMGQSLPSLGSLRDVTDALCARAMLRATDGDVDGFLADVKAVRQMARHIGGCPTLIERLVAIAIESTAASAVGAAAAHGALTLAECQTVEAALASFAPLPSVGECLDVNQRWEILDSIQWLSLGQAGSASADPPDDAQTLAKIANMVDWDVILQRANAMMDDQVRATHASSIKMLKAASAAASQSFVELQTNGGGRDLHKGVTESREAYTQRLGDYLVGMARPSFAKAEELYRSAEQQVMMAQVLLAAAEFKAQQGKWPDRQEDLVPGAMAQLPKDMYSADGALPFHYQLKADGPRVYSVGENGRDDGGMRASGGKDDLGIGAN